MDPPSGAFVSSGLVKERHSAKLFCLLIKSVMHSIINCIPPCGMHAIHVYKTGRSRLWVNVSLEPPIFDDSGKPKEILSVNLTLVGEAGELIAEIIGLQVRQLHHSAIRRIFQQHYDDWLYELKWEKVSSPGNSSSSIKKWIIFADRAGLGDNLATQLQLQGLVSTLVK